MQDVITLLPDNVANQIAAGEVVQRPASVVKELLENAIDAGATHIKLIIKDAGKTLIQVIDNGRGMSPADARMCFERHATSKIKKAEDLFQLHTKGFRGEALASIAAVAQVELKTKRDSDLVGQLIDVEGNKVTRQEETQASTGSSFSVKNLFFNIPARRNFLKEDTTELKHILDEFERVALPHFNIHFQLFSNNNELFNLPPTTLMQRIMGISGNNQKDRLVTIQEETDVVKISGYVGKPETAKKKRGDQYFFINNRFIKSGYLNHAVYEAYRDLMSPENNPAYYLFLEIDPAKIDINIHPTKTEIKFLDEKIIYAILHSSVKRALGKANLAPSIDFNTEMSFELQGPSSDRIVTAPKIHYNPDYNPFNSDQNTTGSGKSSSGHYHPREESPLHRHNQENWHKLYDAYTGGTVSNPGELQEQTESPSLRPDAQDLGLNDAQRFKSFQLSGKYIITAHASGLLILDQQRAHERILYEHYLNTKQQHPLSTQQMLFPVTLELSVNDFTLMETMMPLLKNLGFDIEPFGKNTIVVQGTPAELGDFNVQEIIEGILEAYKLNTIDTKLDPFDNLCRSMARNTSIKYGKLLEDEEMQLIVSHLFQCENPMYSPAGKPVLMEMEKTDIEKFFKR